MRIVESKEELRDIILEGLRKQGVDIENFKLDSKKRYKIEFDTPILVKIPIVEPSDDLIKLFDSLQWDDIGIGHVEVHHTKKIKKYYYYDSSGNYFSVEKNHLGYLYDDIVKKIANALKYKKLYVNYNSSDSNSNDSNSSDSSDTYNFTLDDILTLINKNKSKKVIKEEAKKFINLLLGRDLSPLQPIIDKLTVEDIIKEPINEQINEQSREQNQVVILATLLAAMDEDNRRIKFNSIEEKLIYRLHRIEQFLDNLKLNNINLPVYSTKLIYEYLITHDTPKKQSDEPLGMASRSEVYSSDPKKATMFIPTEKYDRPIVDALYYILEQNTNNKGPINKEKTNKEKTNKEKRPKTERLILKTEPLYSSSGIYSDIYDVAKRLFFAANKLKNEPKNEPQKGQLKEKNSTNKPKKEKLRRKGYKNELTTYIRQEIIEYFKVLDKELKVDSGIYLFDKETLPSVGIHNHMSYGDLFMSKNMALYDFVKGEKIYSTLDDEEDTPEIKITIKFPTYGLKGIYYLIRIDGYTLSINKAPQKGLTIKHSWLTNQNETGIYTNRIKANLVFDYGTMVLSLTQKVASGKYSLVKRYLPLI